MRAIRFETSGTAHVVDIPRPVPGPGEVLLAVTSTGVCGSDLAALRGTHPFRVPPLISGHEAGGRVAEVGPDVAARAGGAPGVGDPHRPRGPGDQCTTGGDHQCARHQ
ncbi:MAG: alcohol dehydrogenase catalytic domain-containing protein, partial [Cellulosimicrobium funkei]